MNDEFIQSIKSQGYWRINIRPLGIRQADPLTLNSAQQAVRQSSVSLRGWDYPHVPSRTGNDTAIERHDKFVQAWVDWMNHREFWRMYTSSQFIHYRALHEDWRDRDQFGQSGWDRAPEGPVLSVLGNLWLIVEVCEFLARLAAQVGLYEDGARLSIQLHSGPASRALWIDDYRRFPFNYNRTTNAATITFERQLSHVELASPRTIAAEAARYLFDRFGWNPTEDQLVADIDKLYHL
jgi:hypothetical protein